LKDKDRTYKEFYSTELMEVRLKSDPGMWQAENASFWLSQRYWWRWDDLPCRLVI